MSNREEGVMSISYRSSLGEDPSHEPLLEATNSLECAASASLHLDEHHHPLETEDEATQKKKFIFSLVCQLHKAGNFSFRTETYVAQVATAFNLHATCAVFPVSAILSFQETAQLSPHSCEAYNIAISSGYDCSKLSRLDQLCFEIQQGRVDFQTARVILTDIEVAGTYVPFLSSDSGSNPLQVPVVYNNGRVWSCILFCHFTFLWWEFEGRWLGFCSWSNCQLLWQFVCHPPWLI
jgi:hypothetical protein